MLKLLLTIQAIFLAFVISYFGEYFTPKKEKTEITICHTLASENMAQFVMDPSFQAFHPKPQLIDFQGIGTAINYPTTDGTNANAYLIKAKKKSKKWLFVYQEWWGLNDNIRQQADKFYRDLGENVNVLAIDMYDGKVTANPQEAGKLMSGVNETRLENIVNGAIKFSGKKAKIANVGWCFGGGWSLKSALLGKKQTVGSIIYYGMPVRDVEKLKMLNSDVLGIFATENYISKKIIEEFAESMKQAGKQLEYKIFDGVHGFANPSNPKHDAALAKEAYTMSLNYLKKKF